MSRIGPRRSHDRPRLRPPRAAGRRDPAGRVVLVALLAGALVAMAGCADRAPSHETPSTVGPGFTGTLTVFAAASLTETFGELASRFEAQHPELDVVIVLSGSATLVQQLIAGAPADVFASADEQTMQRAVEAGAVGRPAAFARNPLALAVPAGNPGGVGGLGDLARADLLVALCASEVPCGRAADAMLAARGVSASVDSRESDVRAVLTKVQLGEVDAGIVYRTDVRVAQDAVEMIDIGTVDAQRFAPTYQIALVEGTGRGAAAEAWLDLVLGEAGRAVLDAAGFDTAHLPATERTGSP